MKLLAIYGSFIYVPMKGGGAMKAVEMESLTEERFTEALAVFKTSGWDEESLFYVKMEMRAFLQGDIYGYIRAHFTTAIVDNKIVGVAAWAPAMCSFWLYELSWATVLPEWRHQGINALMLAARLRQIRSHHGSEAFSVMVCTWQNALYSKYGFRPMQLPERGSPDKKGKCLLLAQFDSAAANDHCEINLL
jgi:N-acetylglutamate synthase-like GNAT family acetyltransferase